MKTFNIMKQQAILLEACIKLMKMVNREDLTDEEYKLMNELNEQIDNICDMILDARSNNKISFWTASVLTIFNINSWIKVIQYRIYLRKS